MSISKISRKIFIILTIISFFRFEKRIIFFKITIRDSNKMYLANILNNSFIRRSISIIIILLL